MRIHLATQCISISDRQQSVNSLTRYIPLLGERLALPLVDLAGSKQIGDQAFNEIFHPIAARLLEKCDAVLRVGGPSAGADEMVRVGRSFGLKIYTSLAEIPKS